MPSVNKVIIVGNLGADPITRFTPSGDQVTSISVATTFRWKDKQSGDDREETEWHKIVFFGRQAEVAAEYLKKGLPVYVEGSLQTKKWTDKDHVERYTTQIRAHNLQLLGRKEEAEPAERNSAQRGSSGPHTEAAPRTEVKPAEKKPVGRFDDMLDDLPF